MSILLITHDLGVIAEMADRVAVMYASKIVEFADTVTLYDEPRHPYTFGLFQSLPETHVASNPRLNEIPGTVPSPLHFPSGCKFRTRCWKATALCAEVEPPLVDVGEGHLLACHHPVTDDERAHPERLPGAGSRTREEGPR
jgi:peptide/nickel transport system ATP-binding protein/oligopeptide transport system ATP-binding protein